MIKDRITGKKRAITRNAKEAVVTNSAGRTTLISPGTTIRGDISFTGHLDIEGEVSGSIQAEAGQDAILRIVEGGKVAGEVKVPHACLLYTSDAADE